MDKYLVNAKGELVIKPYSYMMNIGKIREKLCARKSDFMYTEGLKKIIDDDLKDTILGNQKLALD